MISGSEKQTCGCLLNFSDGANIGLNKVTASSLPAPPMNVFGAVLDSTRTLVEHVFGAMQWA